MKFEELLKRALEIRKKYQEFEAKHFGESWDGKDLMSGFMGDVGDLAKLITAKEGKRMIDDVDTKLEHELADCLWSVIAIANKYSVNLEAAFIKTMDELDQRLERGEE